MYAADRVLPVGSEPLHHGAVAVADGVIVAVGPRAEVFAAYPDATVEELGSAILMPALVNAHTHLEYANYGGFGDGLPFAAWLADHLARRPRLTEDDITAAADLGALQCLRSGVGTIADASYAGASLIAAATAGLRGTVHLESFGGPDADPAVVAEAAASRLDLLSAATTPLLGLGISPHSPYSVAPAVLRALDELARARATTMVMHVAESEAELEAVRDGTGPIADALAHLTRVEATASHPVDLLAALGVLRPGVLAIHAVQLETSHVELIARSGAAVVHCPRSNAILGCGAARVADLRAAGVTVAIGTDSPASAIDFDLWSEMRAAVFSARTRERRADALTTRDVVEMATIDGARALGLDALIGTLEPGKSADLTPVDLIGSPPADVEDPLTSAVFAGSPDRIVVTVVDGVVRYRRSVDAGRLVALEGRAAPGRRRMIGHDD